MKNIVKDKIALHISDHIPTEQIDWTMVEEQIMMDLEEHVEEELWESDFFYDMVHIYVEHLKTTAWYVRKIDEAEHAYKEYLEDQKDITRWRNP